MAKVLSAGSANASSNATTAQRSVSRGRDIVSTGRGGAGNFVRGDSASRGRVSRELDGDERGRELSPSNTERVTHTGRGGAGNVRSRSRGAAAIREELSQERELIDASKNPSEQVFSTGRGGIGNIKASPNTSVSRERNDTRSLSRDPPPGKRQTSSGRGGRGNIHVNSEYTQRELERLDEDDRAVAGGTDEANKLHSTGRGGAGNLTTRDSAEKYSTAEVPTVEGLHSHGKGGYGNIMDAARNSTSTAPTKEDGRGRSDAKHPHGLAGDL